MSSSYGRYWLLEPNAEPAANLASSLHAATAEKIPVPIEGMIGQVANVEEHHWPFDCDALAVGLFTRRPMVFLKAGVARRRRRFTLAHEYGHIMMGWHVGEIACKLNEDSFSVEQLQPARSPDDLLARRRVIEQEAEASRFAAYLLMPDAFLRPLFDSGDMGLILQESRILDVSTIALLLRLREMLQPGFAFELIASNTRKFFQSSGTVIKSVLIRGGEVDGSELAQNAVDCGTVTIGNHRVRWYRLSEFEQFDAVRNDGRSSSQILREAIARHVSDDVTRLSVFQSINGVAGGSLSRERATNPTQALALLRHKFSSSTHVAITRDPLFDTYLRSKAAEWAQRRGLL